MWSFEQIRAVTDGSWVVEPGEDSPAPMGASIDSRSVSKGQIFFAFVGEQVDGHRYLGDAQERGAGLLVVTDASRVPDGLHTPTLCVDEPVEALTKLAEHWRSMIAARVIAVTGSNGKTTTCRMLDAVLSGFGSGTVSQKSFNNQLGVPITVLNAKADDAYLVCEIGTSSPGEVLARTTLCAPDVSVIVSIGQAHLQELGSTAGVIAEKSCIARGAGAVVIPDGIIGLEDAVRSHNPGRVIVVGAEERAAVSLLGDHNQRNAALVARVCSEMGMGDDQISDGLSRVHPPPMRLERVVVQTEHEPIVVINDAYNANPDSMLGSIEVLCGFDSTGRRVAVLGDMLELGDQSLHAHQAVLGWACDHERVDLVITLGEHFAGAAGGEGGSQSIAGSDNASIEQAARLIEPGDVVLLKGSRSMRIERVLGALRDRFGCGASEGKG